MPRNPTPIHPRRKLEKEYERMLRREVLDPLFVSLRTGLADAVAVAQVYRAAEQAVAAAAERGVPIALIRAALERIKGYHDNRLYSTFRTALGVDVRPVLLEPPVASFMKRKVEENVWLISTIPPRMHDSLIQRIDKLQEVAPFDRQALQTVLRSEYKSTGYNLRRITRDQNNKMIGNLTKIRQQQLRIEGYQWSTSQDERVRPTHAAKDGSFFRWDNPPPDEGHPGTAIQCRCVAIPALRKADRERLREIGRQ